MEADPPIEVVVIVCGHNSRRHLDDCLSSVLAGDAAGLRVHVVFVDDAGQDDSGDHVRQQYPAATVLRLEENQGFAGANNAGWAYACARHPGARYLALLNVDTYVDPHWLTAAVGQLEQQPDAGAVQCKLRLHPEVERLNSAGNRCHYLAFGWVSAYGEVDRGQYDDDAREIDYASGAAVVVRAALVRDLGLFDPGLFMYHEDTDLSWKLKLTGHAVRLAPGSIVYHKYQASAPVRYYYELERNRWILMLSYYRVSTLLLIAPAAALMEAGQLFWALRQGVLGAKLRAWGWFFGPANLRYLLGRRRRLQRLRKVPDRQWVGRFAGRIQHPAVEHVLLRWIGNPLLAGWWAVVRRLMI